MRCARFIKMQCAIDSFHAMHIEMKDMLKKLQHKTCYVEQIITLRGLTTYIKSLALVSKMMRIESHECEKKVISFMSVKSQHF